MNLVFIASAAAQSPTATDSAAQLRDRVKEKVQEELNTIKKATAPKSYVGTVTKKDDLTLTLVNLHDEVRTVIVSTATAIKLPGGKEGTPADIKVKDFLIAMGDADSTNTLTAKRVVVTSKPDPDPRQVSYGEVTKSSSSSFSLGETTFKITSDTKLPKSRSSSLKVNDTVVVISVSKTAKKIYLVSPAIPPSPSPKPTPKPSPTPTS